VKEGIASFALAMDINEDPLEKAKNNGLAYHISDSLDTRLSNGLEKLKPGEVDCVIIAGMGGKLIETILEASKNKLGTYKRLILSPHKDIESVRMKIAELKMSIIEESMLYEDNHYYNFIVVNPQSIESITEGLKVKGSKTEMDCLKDRLSNQVLGNTKKEKNNVIEKELLEFYEEKELLDKICNKYGKILLMNKDQCLRNQLNDVIPKLEILQQQLEVKKISKRVIELGEEIEIGKKVLTWLS
jgi:tRNA A22 N-methylase